MACIPINEKRCRSLDPSLGQRIGSTLSFHNFGRVITRHIIERALRAAENSIAQ